MKKIMLVLAVLITTLTANAQMHLLMTEEEIRADQDIFIISEALDKENNLNQLRGVDKLGNKVEFFLTTEEPKQCVISIIFVDWEDVAGISKLLDSLYGRDGYFQWRVTDQPITIEMEQEETLERPWVMGYVQEKFLKREK